MSEFFDTLETRDPAQREQALLATLPQALGQAAARAPAIARQLGQFNPHALTTRAALAMVPVIRKTQLLELQHDARTRLAAHGSVIERVFGGFSSIGWGAAQRVFASPGPIYEPESARPDYWRFARALYAAGFRAGDLAALFFQRLDSAILMRNASTQFADGGEFGMGGEIGIATGKLHARGPVGAEQLCSVKYLVTGDGTIRS